MLKSWVVAATAIALTSAWLTAQQAQACSRVSTEANGGDVGGRRYYDCKEDTDATADSTPPADPSTPAKPKPKQISKIGFTLDPRLSRDDEVCLPNTTACLYIEWVDKKKPTKKQKAALEAQLRQVVTQLKLPNPTPRFGPDPSVNEWKMLAVGFPVWLWTDSPKTVTSTATKDGLTFTLKATWTSTTFRMGDGHTKTCSRTSVYPAQIDKPGSPSPTCGYIYDTASPKGHPYTVTAETHWRIDWSTGGQSGSFNHTYTGSRTLEIGELASMIKH